MSNYTSELDPDTIFPSISLPELNFDSWSTFFEFIIVILIIIIICYLAYKFYYGNNKYLNNQIQLPDFKNKTILDIFGKFAKEYPDFPALMVRKDNGNWTYVTYEDYYKNCVKFAKEINYWIGSKANVAILGFNSPAWFYSHLGSLMNMGTSIGMYPTSSGEICEYILNHAEVDVLVLEDTKQLEKLIGKNIPRVKLILYYSPISDELVKKFDIPIVSFGAFMDSTEKDKIKLKSKSNENDIATIIYTSGTTGDPKGVVISHKNIITTCESILTTIKDKLNISYGERFVSYLPLNHIAAQMMDIYIPICTLGIVWFADKDALRSTLVNTLKDARPTIFIGVPRVWEKMKEKIEEKVKSSYLPIILIRNKIVNELGLNKCKFCITAAAPISPETKDFFDSLNLPLHDIYGLSETTGPITISEIPIKNVRVKISQDGEILVKSKSVFKEYYKDPVSTKEAFIDSWFKTGDLGLIKNGHLFVTGRLKELIITSGGENIAPIPIEQKISSFIPELEHVVVIGDKQKFLTAILIPKMKNNKLSNEFKKIDPEIKTLKDLNTSKKFVDYINSNIDKVNKLSKSNANKIQKWIFIDSEFTVGQELTPTLKLRRYFINEKYKDKINKMYL